MKRSICVICGLLFALHLYALVAFAQQQQFANLGDFKLQNGGVIRNCRIGYRTFGTLNSDKSNVIVFPDVGRRHNRTTQVELWTRTTDRQHVVLRRCH